MHHHITKSAQWYAKNLGWAVHPLKGKIPLLKDWPNQATTDPEIIQRWWGEYPTANAGVLCGKRSGIVVIDIDPRNGGEASFEELVTELGPLPPTPEALTGGGGRHIYLRYPKERTVPKSTPLPGIDIQSEGSQVVAPPSIHPETGRRYLWEESSRPNATPLADLPQKWLDFLSEKEKGKKDEQDEHDIPEGGRNRALTRLAGKMRHAGATLSEIEAALLTFNSARCHPPLGKEEVLRVAKSVARYNRGAEEEDWTISRVSDLWDEAEEEIPWCVEDLLPEGSLAILGSRPKLGKSTFARCMALSVATGRPFLDLDVVKGDVIYLALEERRASVVSQFRTLAMVGFGMTESEARDALSHIGLICGPSPKNVIPKLRKLVEEHKPVLVLVDTLSRLLRLKDFNDYAETSSALEFLLHLAHDGTSILLLHHTKKSDSGDLLGSTGIQASPDVLLNLGRRDQVRTLSALGRGVSFEETTLAYHPEGLFYSGGLPVEELEIQTMEGKIVEFIQKNDKGDGVYRKEIEKVEGRKQTKNLAIKRLEEMKKIERRGTPRSKKDPLRFVMVPSKDCSQK